MDGAWAERRVKAHIKKHLVGARVFRLPSGMPDFLVFRPLTGETIYIEVKSSKTSEKPPAFRRLRPAQRDWLASNNTYLAFVTPKGEIEFFKAMGVNCGWYSCKVHYLW